MTLFQPLLDSYGPQADNYDEYFLGPRDARPAFQQTLRALNGLTADSHQRNQELAERALLNQGVTFSVYADQRGQEKIFPFCLLPRLISQAEWAQVEKGLVQRVQALQCFLDDVYGEQRILSEGHIGREWVLGAKGYVAGLRGVKPPGGVRLHVSGIDLIRDPSGKFLVLEDNLRVPSGVSYVLENREVSKRIVPGLLDLARALPVDDYPARLANALRSISPRPSHDCTVVVLTPGPFNSAYFEHTFLARMTGLPLVQPADLFVESDTVFMRTTRGPRRVDVIYRRIDESFLDPEMFRPDSLLGVRGLMRAYQRGSVALANAPGNGVADDKALYAFVPEMIRFYLSEEPLLAQVPTYLCERPDDRSFVVDHLHELVVKAVDEAGGYGMLMGAQATQAERDEFRARILAEPRRYIAQPRVELSLCPSWDAEKRSVVPRRVDLRPYIVTGKDGSWVLPGGLTRVALREGSYVVNSSQGGGAKDTWVVKERA